MSTRCGAVSKNTLQFIFKITDGISRGARYLTDHRVAKHTSFAISHFKVIKTQNYEQKSSTLLLPINQTLQANSENRDDEL
jgi:hypothetical protein